MTSAPHTPDGTPPPPSFFKENSGLFAALGAMLIWGTLPLYWVLVQKVPSILILAHRVVWSFIFIVPVCISVNRFGEVLAIFKNWRVLRVLIASSCILGCNWLIFIWAVLNNHVIEVSLGYYINPLISIVLGVFFFRDRPSRTQWLAIAIAALGVAWQIYNMGFVPWVALGLGSTFGVYGLLKKTAPVESLPGLTMETGILFLPALAFVLWSLYSGYPFLSSETLLQDSALIGTGVVTAIPLIWFTYGVRRLSLTSIGLIQYLSPSITFLLGLFVFHEPFTRSLAVSFSCIWLALALYTCDSWHNSNVARRKRANTAS